MYTEEMKQKIREQIKAYMEETGRSIAETAELAGVSRPALSLFVNDNYKADGGAMAEKLEGFLNRLYGYHSTRAAAGATLRKPDFIPTADTAWALDICQKCQDFATLGMIIGRPGYGKTYSLRRYARGKKVAYIECDDTMSCRDLVDAIRAALGMERGSGTVWRQVNGIREFLNDHKGWLLIIDEADKLVTRSTAKKMEILRGIFDQSEAGLVLAGEPKLKEKVVAYLERMASRTEYFAELCGMQTAEVERFLEGFEVEPAAMEALKKRATNSRNGSFRLLDRTLNNIIRSLSESGETRITAELVAAMSKDSLL